MRLRRAMSASKPIPAPIPAFAPMLRPEGAGVVVVDCVETAGSVFVGGVEVVCEGNYVH
jgi:hypothetical protein